MAVLALAAGSACGGGAVELQGIDLPVAETPAIVEDVTWAVAFTADFPADFWSGGEHRYRMLLDCPVLAAEVATSAINFRVTDLTLLQPGPVYLRPAGLSHALLQPPQPGSINPDQPTIAALSLVGNSRQDADEAARTCEGTFEYDGGQTVPLTPLEPFQP